MAWVSPIAGGKDVKQAEILTSSDDHAEKLKFAKKTGSNFRLVNRELVSLPREAWQLVVDQGSFAQSNIASPCGDAIFSGETRLDLLKRRRGDSNPRGGLSRLQNFQ
jgi:hypothetical protein